MHSKFPVCAVLIALAAHSVPAKADENHQFVKVSCAPELRFFEVSRVSFNNLPYGAELLDHHGAPNPPAFMRLARTRGIYDVPTLTRQSFNCQASGKLRDWRGSGPWPSFRVNVHAIPKFWVASVEVNGITVGTIDLSEEHASFGVHYISVQDNGVGIWVRVCTEGSEVGCRAGYVSDMRIPQ